MISVLRWLGVSSGSDVRFRRDIPALLAVDVLLSSTHYICSRSECVPGTPLSTGLLTGASLDGYLAAGMVGWVAPRCYWLHTRGELDVFSLGAETAAN
jgi:hypothetical protein